MPHTRGAAKSKPPAGQKTAPADAPGEAALVNAQLRRSLALRVLERDEALADVSQITSQVERRLAERTTERDDVARDEALAELGRTNAELKKRLAARTIERDAVARKIASIELTRTNAAEELLRLHAWELESLNAELESFSYSVAHDLRAPVRAIVGFVQALEEECASEIGAEGRRLLGIVQQEASRMGTLIDELLAFSKLGRQPMLKLTVNMNTLVREAVAEQVATLGNEAVAITIEDLPGVLGDRALLRQVWVNLISNAYKYVGKAAAPEVRIWATSEDATTTYHISDNGVGFDMRYARKLFGVFQRLHRGDEFPGTGVGLAIVMRVIKRHGGAIRADARLGEGATFSFELPNGGTT